jgi:trehalose/maltose hydrolase-like predicted phosphorylase
LDFQSQNDGSTPDITAVAGYNVTANASTISQGYQFNLTGPISITKFVGVASTDAFADPQGEAMNSSVTAVQTGWEELVSEHIQAWEELWDSADIVVPNNQEVQLTARSALFHLWSNVRSGYEQPGIGDTSIAPAGLTSDSYAGQVNVISNPR